MPTTQRERQRATMRELANYKAVAAALGADEQRASEIAGRIADERPDLDNAEVFILALHEIAEDRQLGAAGENARVPNLTEREQLVLERIAEGYTIPEIQPMLTQPAARGSHAGKPPGRHAAQSAAEQLRVKLGAHSLPQVVHRAHQLGLLH